MPSNLLLTGRPGIGQTTVIRKVAERLGAQAGGFYTEEVREGRRRVGFQVVTLDNRRAWLAHVRMRSRYRVGRYGVDLDGFERLIIPTLQQALVHKRVILLDEIGPMELLSTTFVQLVSELLDNERPFIATIMAKQHPWADAVKAREDVELWEVTLANRDGLPDQVLHWLQRLGGTGLTLNARTPQTSRSR